MQCYRPIRARNYTGLTSTLLCPPTCPLARINHRPYSTETICSVGNSGLLWARGIREFRV
jgi:hypothetical protein